MKFLAATLVVLWSLPAFSFSLADFAAVENAGKPDGVIYWHGTGTKVDAPSGDKEGFIASLTMRNLGNHVILFQYHIIGAGWEEHPHLIAVVQEHGFFTIYVPNKQRNTVIAVDETVNLDNYTKSGWGHSVGNSMYFDYEAGHGHKGLQHYRSYHDEDGNFRLDSTGSMGTAAAGLKFTWTEDLKRVFVRRP